MALQRDTYYPGRYTTGDAAHPQGAFKNRTTPTSQDGSYLEKDWLNDWDGFFASLLDKAGLTPDATVDEVGASQYFAGLLDLVSRGDYVTAGGTANAIILTHDTPITAYADGQIFRFKATGTNTGATTINVDTIGIITLYGAGGSALQGGELTTNGYAIAVYSSALSGMVLISCTGGATQIAAGTKSNHALSLSQFIGTKITSGYLKIPFIDAADGITNRVLFIQWGRGLSSTGGTVNTFPTTFPNECLAVIGSTSNPTSIYAISFTINSTSQFTATSATASPANYYIAIGW